MTKKPCVATRCQQLHGTLTIPGDKSISHRALLLSSQRIGKTTIHGLLEGEDVLHTKAALQHLGVSISKQDDSYIVQGVGIGGLSESTQPLDMGNSGTAARLMMGLVAPYPFPSFFYGDDSLSKRPMKRVITPLSQMGANVMSRSENRLPISITGQSDMLPIEYELPVASAQVKSCVLLAGLNIAGTTTVIEKHPTRDHTERMLNHYGIPVETVELENGARKISINGHAKQSASDMELRVPADPSSAAFPMVAALIVPDSNITMPNICMNETRTGLFEALKRMGADIIITNEREEAGEPVADIRVKCSSLKAVELDSDIVPSMIDEFPILAVAAAYAEGTSRFKGLAELRVKESDRLSAIQQGLEVCGVNATIEGDDLIIEGCAGNIPGGGTVTTHFDHRIAMSFLVLGLVSQKPVIVDDATAINTSFPNFMELMNNAGAFITEERRRTKAKRVSMGRPIVIAIDGPAASGKGTLARRIAARLNLPYLDTGLLYRAVGMKLVYEDKDPNIKEDAIAAALSIDEHDFSNPRLRQERVGQAASVVSAMPEVRAILLNYQRDFANSERGAVLDGRDIGTIVCPEADFKIFMTASIDTRADRRHRQLQGQGIEVVYESVKNDLIERDKRDSERKNAPLVAADDAQKIDTTDMSAEEVFEQVLVKLDEKLASKAA
ncbi:MAG: 3-phosphoshikimate 1-carboxyvinyltransferase [Rickettsiales bacterium]|nr:3-phosphoshikimate 1-carboxyvinyltransferase [Rickettsiales bacterium]